MTLQKVTALRKEGKLKEAYLLAESYLQERPDDMWGKRAMAWVLYEYLKNSEGKNELFCRVLNKFALLVLPKEEGMVFNQVAWTTAKHLNTLHDDFATVMPDCLAALSDIDFPPSEGYSYLLHVAHNYRGQWSGHVEFCQWWDFGKLMPKDFERQANEQGQKYMSLAESVLIGYAKAVIQSGNAQDMEACLQLLSATYEQHADFDYVLYYEAQLQLALHRKEDAFRLLLPFVRKKNRNYWVWQVLGDASSDVNQAFACYSKALLCPSKPEMQIRLKVRYAEMLIGRDMMAEAKLEILQVVEIARRNKWRIYPELCDWMQQKWFGNVEACRNNKSIYQRFAHEADNLLLADLEQADILISHLNTVKSIANFITPDLQTGFFGYGRMKFTPQLGHTYHAYFSELGQGKASRIASLDKCKDNSVWKNVTTEFAGIMRMAKEQNFGLVHCSFGDVFVPKSLLGNLQAKDNVTGYAVKSFDRLKGRWGWTALSIKIK